LGEAILGYGDAIDAGRRDEAEALFVAARAIGEHQHCEADLGQERSRRIAGVDPAQPVPPEQHPRGDLADHQWQPPLGPCCQQRTSQLGGHDQARSPNVTPASFAPRRPHHSLPPHHQLAGVVTALPLCSGPHSPITASVSPGE
jgi:hypothetical protein